MKEGSAAFEDGYLKDAVVLFEQYKRLAEKALEQISDDEFFEVRSEAENSLAIIVTHIAGNQRSRWTNFLTEDGEKPDRDRDSEFVSADITRVEVMTRWDAGWELLFDTLENLKAADLSKQVAIRGEKITVIQAINRQLTHYAYHVGQIAFLAKSFRGSEWKSLSVPKGGSEEFNRFMSGRSGGGAQDKHYLEEAREYFSNKDRAPDKS